MTDPFPEKVSNPEEQESTNIEGVSPTPIKSPEERVNSFVSIFSSPEFQESWGVLQEHIANIPSFTAILSEAIGTLSTCLADILVELPLLGISKEVREKKIELYEKWGEFGWPVPLDIPPSDIPDLPLSIEEAEHRMAPFCDSWDKNLTENTKELFEYDISNDDLESAIFCYQNQNYKACALLLFGIIDSQLIITHPKQKSKKHRPSGKKAIDNILCRLEQTEDQQALYHLLQLKNLLSCLNALFAHGKDFENEPDILNRNFISHGMNRRPVKKQDCIQLFLALQNLLFLLPTIQQLLSTAEDV